MEIAWAKAIPLAVLAVFSLLIPSIDIGKMTLILNSASKLPSVIVDMLPPYDKNIIGLPDTSLPTDLIDPVKEYT